MKLTKDAYLHFPLMESNIMIVLRLEDTLPGVTMNVEMSTGIIAVIAMFVTTRVMILTATYWKVMDIVQKTWNSWKWIVESLVDIVVTCLLYTSDAADE